MKKLSIRLRVTLWFTALMTLLVAIVLAFLFSVSGSLVHSESQKKLENLVNLVRTELLDDGESDIPDEFVSGHDESYVAVFAADGSLLNGVLPADLELNLPFADQKTQSFESNDKNWTVYDRQVILADQSTVWVRGISASREEGTTYSAMLRLALIASPFLILLAAAGGYFITGRAFRPVKQITELAERIGDGKDLSQRISLGQGKDEIYELAATFDRMFDRLEASFETEKQFTSDASHELRTPTSVIISQCEYAIENADTLDEAKAALSTVLRQAQKMSGLIAQLLTLARADKGQQKLNIELVNLSELFELVMAEQSELAADKGIAIQTHITPNLLIHGDQTLLMRMLINLVTNGINYGRRGGSISAELETDGRQIIGRVRDDGIGIAPEHLDKIWERFYQVEASRSPSDSGVGLGLSMVKWIAEAHGGSVSAASEPGVGSVFTFTLPSH